MTSEEFTEWLKYHQARFQKFARWLNAEPVLSTDPSPAQKMQACYTALADTELDDAKRASETFYCRSATFSDTYSTETHATDVARIAKEFYQEPDRRYLDPPDRNETFRCPHCRDAKAPYVAVYGRSFVEWFARQDPPPVTVARTGEHWFDLEDRRWLDEQTRDLRYALSGLAVRCVCRPYHDDSRRTCRDLDPERDVVCLYPDMSNLIEALERTPA